MRHSIFVIAILIVVSPIICGPASSNEADSVYISSQQMISILHSCLNHARQVLENQVDLTPDYQEQVYLLTSILQDIENKLKGIETCSSLNPSRFDSSPVQSSCELDEQTRIRVIGARALTEFKAQQLSYQVHNLTKESQNKQSDFDNTVEKATALSEEVARLKNLLQQAIPNIQLAENKVKPIGGPKKQSWEYEVCQFQRNISEEDKPFVTFQQASAESAQLKTTDKLVMQETTPLNSKPAVSVDELKKQMEQAAKQAKALQELVSKIVAQTEILKMQGQQIELKLNDMRRVTKMWQEKKIPVNSEARVLENNLSNEMAIYQNTLEEIGRLNQFLTSIFNGVLQTGPTR